MRETGLKVAGNILVGILTRMTVVLPSRTEGSVSAPGGITQKDRTSAHRRMLGARRGRGESPGGCEQEGGPTGVPEPSPAPSPAAQRVPGRQSRDGQNATGRAASDRPKPSVSPETFSGGGTVPTPPPSAPRTTSSYNFSMRGGQTPVA